MQSNMDAGDERPCVRSAGFRSGSHAMRLSDDLTLKAPPAELPVHHVTFCTPLFSSQPMAASPQVIPHWLGKPARNKSQLAAPGSGRSKHCAI